MSASSSSRIDPAIGHLAALGQSLVDERSDVLSVLGQVADPRKRRGVRHTLPVILGVVVCAVLAGARSFVAIAEWAADADDATLVDLGAGAVVPCESTIRRTLQTLDADALDDAFGGWAQARTKPSPAPRSASVVSSASAAHSAIATNERAPASTAHGSCPYRHPPTLGVSQTHPDHPARPTLPTPWPLPTATGTGCMNPREWQETLRFEGMASKSASELVQRHGCSFGVDDSFVRSQTTNSVQTVRIW